MLTKISLIVLLLAFSLPCLAQTPRIDSIAVDEDKGELVLHGDFQNSASSIVTVDTVSLPIVNISDSILHVTIPFKGPGSCGLIKVTANGDESNTKLLTYIHFQVYYHYYFPNNNYSYNYLHEDTIHVRAIFDRSSVSDFDYYSLPISKLSRCHDKGLVTDIGYRKEFDSSGILSFKLLYYPKIRTFQYSIDDHRLSGNSIVNQQVDEYFYPVAKIQNSSCSGGFIDCLRWGPIAATDFPPAISVVNQSHVSSTIVDTRLSSNPVLSNTELIVTLQENTNVRIEIMDILGNVRSSEEKMLFPGENRLPLNSSSLAGGVYICRLQAGNEIRSLRFVKE